MVTSTVNWVCERLQVELIGPFIWWSQSSRGVNLGISPHPPLLPLACMLLTCKQFMRVLSIFHGAEMDVSCQEWRQGGNSRDTATRAREWGGSSHRSDGGDTWAERIRRRMKLEEEEVRGEQEEGEEERICTICATDSLTNLSAINFHLTSSIPLPHLDSKCGASWTHWLWLCGWEWTEEKKWKRDEQGPRGRREEGKAEMKEGDAVSRLS